MAGGPLKVGFVFSFMCLPGTLVLGRGTLSASVSLSSVQRVVQPQTSFQASAVCVVSPFFASVTVSVLMKYNFK